MARIVGRYPSDEEAHLQMRATLLAPIWHLQEEDRKRRKTGPRSPASEPAPEDTLEVEPVAEENCDPEEDATPSEPTVPDEEPAAAADEPPPVDAAPPGATAPGDQ